MYDVVIGIEIHLELMTATKMFSSAPYAFKKNVNTCVNEVDIASPGTLPSVNKEAVRKAIQACTALHLQIDPLLRFDRKNYYYSDLPKGYQITQQFHPIGSQGYLDIETSQGQRRIGIERIHLEEDTAKQFHVQNRTLIDYNRAGVPLIELVSKPDIRSGEEAALYVEKIQKTMEYLGVSDAKMEEGSMRCDINISLKEAGSSAFGTKVEIKNLNSVANISAAITYEIARQGALLDAGEKIIQETRRYDEASTSTVSMRKKEGSVDYKYFPEPNIFPIRLAPAFIKEIVEHMPELPDEKARRFSCEYQLSEYDIQVLLNNREMCCFFEECLRFSKAAKTICNYLTTDISGLLTKQEMRLADSKLQAKHLAKLADMVEQNTISSKQAKDLLPGLLEGNDPQKLAQEKGMEQVSDESVIREMVLAVIAENPQSVSDFKNGKTHVQGFLVGQVMKRSKGKANPRLAASLVAAELAKC